MFVCIQKMLFARLLNSFFVYCYMTFHPLDIKTTVDLRSMFPRPFDQGQTYACVSNAIAAVAMFHEKHDRGVKYPSVPSRLDMYYQARQDEYKHDDNVASIEAALYAYRTMGVCNERYWPYIVPYHVKSTPPQCCVRNRVRLVTTPQLLPRTSRCIAYAVRQHRPVIVAVLLPIETEDDETHMSRHAMVVVGVYKNNKHFILRNSWSTAWGTNGHIVVTDTFMNEHVLSAWILRHYDV